MVIGPGGSSRLCEARLKRLVSAQITNKNRFYRLAWGVVWFLLYRPSPKVLHSWRCLLLRLFGAKLGTPVYVYPSTKIWAPWNLEMGDHSTLADNVDCYSVDKIVIGSNSTVSQYSYLCSASHDYADPAILEDPKMPLLSSPITIGDHVWITSDVFVGPGVTVGDGAVVLARSSVFADLPSWKVASGNPATVKKDRVLRKK